MKQSVLLSRCKKLSKTFDLKIRGTNPDNKQYNLQKEIKLKVVQQRVYFFVDFIENQEMKMKKIILIDLSVLIDLYLAEILSIIY